MKKTLIGILFSLSAIAYADFPGVTIIEEGMTCPPGLACSGYVESQEAGDITDEDIKHLKELKEQKKSTQITNTVHS